MIDSFLLTLSAGHRVEAFGPFFYSEDKEGQKTWAVPPLISELRDPATESREVDIAYPILTYDRFGTEYRWQLFQLFSFAGGEVPAEQGARRFTLFPIYFQQRAADTNENYTAVFPIYGYLRNRLFRDEIFFVMFPFYARTRKKDVITDNYVYPFFHLRHGEALTGWQLWPIAGREHKDPVTKTNGFGDLMTVGGHDSWFALWPFYFGAVAGIGTEQPQQTRAFFPFYITVRSPQRDSTTVLWPIFSHIEDREKKYTEREAPWPLVVFARGEGKTTSRVFPFYSHAQTANLESGFFLWPLYKFNAIHAPPLDRMRKRVLLFLCSDTTQKDTETGTTERRVDVWPLFTYRHDHEKRARLQIVSILEPLLPDSKSVERNYSPLWAVWRAERDPNTGAASRSFLWNLYRLDTTPRSKKCSLLFGLFQYQSDSEEKRVRLFYLPIAKSRATGETGSKRGDRDRQDSLPLADTKPK